MNLRLTKREFAVMRLIALGYTYKQIADLMGVDKRSVERYAEHIRDEIGAKNQTHIATYALRNNIVKLDDVNFGRDFESAYAIINGD